MAAAAAPAMRAAPRASAAPVRPPVRETRSAPATKPHLASVDAAEADERIAEESSSIIRALELASREPSQMPAPITLAASPPSRPRRRLRASVVATVAAVAAAAVGSATYLFVVGGNTGIDTSGLRSAWSSFVDRLAPDARAPRADDGAAQRVTAARPITTAGAAGVSGVEAAAADKKSARSTQAVVSSSETAPPDAEPQATTPASNAPPVQAAATTSPSTAAVPAVAPTQRTASDDAAATGAVDAQPASPATKSPRAVRATSPRREARAPSRAAAANVADPRTMAPPSIAPSEPAIPGPCTAGVAALSLCEAHPNGR